MRFKHLIIKVGCFTLFITTENEVQISHYYSGIFYLIPCRLQWERTVEISPHVKVGTCSSFISMELVDSSLHLERINGFLLCTQFGDGSASPESKRGSGILQTYPIGLTDSFHSVYGGKERVFCSFPSLESAPGDQEHCDLN